MSTFAAMRRHCESQVAMVCASTTIINQSPERRLPAIKDVPKIKAALLLNFAEKDPRINDRWAEYETALKANNVKYEAHVYPGTNHGFHNDTTPRFDEAAAKLAWQRTLDHFNKHLKS